MNDILIELEDELKKLEEANDKTHKYVVGMTASFAGWRLAEINKTVLKDHKQNKESLVRINELVNQLRDSQ